MQLNADLLMLCTDVDGLFTGNPADPASEFIPTYCPDVRSYKLQAVLDTSLDYEVVGLLYIRY